MCVCAHAHQYLNGGCEHTKFIRIAKQHLTQRACKMNCNLSLKSERERDVTHACMHSLSSFCCVVVASIDVGRYNKWFDGLSAGV